MATSDSITAAAPSSRNVSCGRQNDSGVRTPAAAATVLATGLSKAIRQASGRGADVRQAEQLEDLADRAVLAGLAVQHRDHAGRRVRGERGQQPGVHVALLHLDPGAAQRLGHPASGAQRDVALVGQAAGEHHDPPLAGRCVGRGHGVSF